MARTSMLSFSILLALGGGVLATAGAAQEVRLPLPAYDDLRARADPPPEPAPPSPIPVAFEEALLTVEVGEHSARVVQELTVVLYAEGWQTLELPGQGVFLSSDFGEIEGFVEARDRNDASRLRLRGQGRHRLTLESAVPLEHDETATRDARSFVLTVPAAAIASGRIFAPPEVREIDVGGYALVSPLEPPGYWRFVPNPGDVVRLTLLGTARGPSREELPLRFEAVTGTTVELSRTRTRAEVSIVHRVLEGRLETITVPLPGGWQVVRVDAEPKAGWEVAGDRLTVTPAEPVAERLVVAVELTREPLTTIRAPLLVPDGAARVERFTRVHVAGDGLLELADAGDARRVHQPPARLPPALSEGPGALFRVDRGEAPRWDVVWSERIQVLAAEVPRLLVDVVVGQDRAFYQVWLETRNTGATSLEVTPPPGFEPVVATRNGALVTPGLRGRDLVLPLTVAAEGQVLFLSGYVPLVLPSGDGRLELLLPALSVPVREVEVRAVLPGRRRYELADPTRRGTVGPPPTIAAVPPRSTLLPGLDEVALAPVAAELEAWIDTPLGFTIVEAAWVALAPSPSPLVLEVSDSHDRKEWF